MTRFAALTGRKYDLFEYAGHPEAERVLVLMGSGAETCHETVARLAGKTITTRHVDGPVGVQSRNFSNARIYGTGWQPRFRLVDGIADTYSWIEAQVRQRDA